jgi:hypothetical protein
MRVGNTACPASMTTRDVAQVGTDGIRSGLPALANFPSPAERGRQVN